jgi:hypothetical protein
VSRREFSSIASNPKRSVGCIFDGVRNLYAGPGSRVWAGKPGRKSSPRKLEPHEVIAKLKARRVAA